MAKGIIDEIEQCYGNIADKRATLAKLRKDKAIKKAPLWEEATGTVDQKKDFIKSQLAEVDNDIALCEADIEFAYNMVDVHKMRLEFTDE